MPNYITTRFRISGPEDDVDQLFHQHVRTRADGDRYIDFETIVPMPECAKKDECSSTTKSVLDVISHCKGMHIAWADLRLLGEWPGLRSLGRGDIEEQIEKHYPGEFAKARNLALLIAETGTYDQIDWAYRYWGAKWNSFRLRVEQDCYWNDPFGKKARYYIVETANGFPEPIFRRLAELFPTLTFHVATFDEGWGMAGRGCFNGANDFQYVAATKEIYEEVYGKTDGDGDDKSESVTSPPEVAVAES